MYDVSSRESFQGLEVWLNELDTYATKKDLIKMLVGNKIDKVMLKDVGVTVTNSISAPPPPPACSYSLPSWWLTPTLDW